MTIRKRGKGAADKRRSAKVKRTPASKAQRKPASTGRRKPRSYGKLPPKQAQQISLADAVALTQRYRKAAPASEHGGFFWAEGLQAILAQPGCVGVRYYHGLNEEGGYQIVLVGVDGDGNDITMLTTAKSATRSVQSASGGEAVLLDHHWPCPPFCADGSPLA